MLARYSIRLSSSDEDVVMSFKTSLGSDAFSIENYYLKIIPVSSICPIYLYLLEQPHAA